MADKGAKKGQEPKPCRPGPSYDLPEGPLPGKPDWSPAPHKPRNYWEVLSEEKQDKKRKRGCSNSSKDCPASGGCSDSGSSGGGAGSAEAKAGGSDSGSGSGAPGTAGYAGAGTAGIGGSSDPGAAGGSEGGSEGSASGGCSDSGADEQVGACSEASNGGKGGD